MKDAAFLVLPSVNYEGFPKTIVESFARGTPVVASRLGAMEELITDGVTGRHFTAGDPSDLSDTVARLSHQAEALQGMRSAVRRTYLDRYTADQNYTIMMQVYRSALRHRHEPETGDD
jgi:glycosyltransferase involved in cell wall biosynthesis